MEGPGEGVGLRDQLADHVGRDRFDLWVADDTKISLTDSGNIDMLFASGFLCDAARRNLNRDLMEAARRLVGGDARVVLRVDETAVATPVRPKMAPQPVAKPEPKLRVHEPSEAAEAQPASTPPAAEPSTAGTFASLVVGRSNELAVRAGVQLAAGNHVGGPLVIWGPPGTGKSHLLASIKHAYRHKFRRARVLSLTAEQFVGTYVEALRGSGLPSFRQKCRGANLLLIDDLHFMAGKRATLEELQHTIDSVTAAGGQVVIASCQEPGNIAKLGDELLSRLRAGLVCEVTAADYTTRLEIARRRCHAIGLPIEEAALQRLAGSVTSGARELLGAVERLRARHELLGEAVDLNLIEDIAGEINHQTTRCVAMDDIQRVVCDHFGIAAKTLRSSSRLKSVTEPRMLAMWLARKYTRAGWREIGEYFGGRRHSTVISAHRRIESQMGQSTRVPSSSGKANLEETVVAIESKLRLA
ncbi:DnaA ATPase domain-containing protein [Aeoliella mucimassa]|uniref:Chromosomal replication initiator protein DnaA n=1 Tax=Aeoliella mucimassa TaxID=2527972 RepID=A0A518ANW7_9BACT|nr:DnaA/Hda family protein [Aeoliella mucimassa]QDU56418.1 Chromosomal replication initiator protein DnaA [Aeoliella mucimassa]